jgi:hypothetical protein
MKTMLNPNRMVYGLLRGVFAGAGLLLIVSSPAIGADEFSAWRSRLSVEVGADGFTELSVPPELLDAAREDLADLRLLDPLGNETAYFRVEPSRGKMVEAAAFRATLTAGMTVLEAEGPGVRRVDGIILESPATKFLKAAKVEGSTDGEEWTLLAEGAPVFREARGVEQLRVGIPVVEARYFRVTIEDRRTDAVVFTGLKLHLAAAEEVPAVPVVVKVIERVELPEQTRLLLDFGSGHLALASVGIETDDSLFVRQVELLAPLLEGAEVREKRLAGGTVFRLAVDGAAARAETELPVSFVTPMRRLVMVIRNRDSQPLDLSGVVASRRAVRLRFMAPETGEYALLAGNPQAEVPRYDIALLSQRLEGAEVAAAVPGEMTANPAYIAPAQVPEVPLIGAVLDTSPWRYRRAVVMDGAGIQELEIDPETLSRSGTRGVDWRLMRGERQVPYLIERPSFSRQLVPKVVALEEDPKRPGLSRWELELPYEGLPGQMLRCSAAEPLFERRAVLVEERTDNYGQGVRQVLGKAVWKRTLKGQDAPQALVLEFDSEPQTDRWYLEIENGDNAPITLDDFRVFYPVVRLLFRADSTEAIDLYYGNANTASARYDLSLAAPQVLRADRMIAALGPEDQLKRRPGGRRIAGEAGWIFWGVLVLVVGALGFLVSRLLPAGDEGANGGG